MEEEQRNVTEEPVGVKESLFNFDEIRDTKSGQVTESKQVKGLTITNFGTGEFIIKFNDVPFGKIDKQGNFTYFNLENAKKAFKKAGMDIKDIDLPDLQQAIDLEEQAKKQEEQKLAEENDGVDNPETNDNMGENEGEKDDKKPVLEPDNDLKLQEIAEQYNLNTRDIVHFANDERVTENEKFKGLVEWSEGYDDVYAVPGEDYYSYKFIGSKNGETEEIEAGNNKVVGGKNPDVTIKRLDGKQITEVKPLAMYEIDANTSIAMVKNEYGEPEAIYCRQQEGDEKVYWGEVIPEASGKNVLQQSHDIRGFMDYRNNSGLDLSEKSYELERQKDLDKRGVPSDNEGVQVEEIQGSYEQNRNLNLEKIKEDLMKRDGIVDKLTVPPGYYENKAEKVLKKMENNETILYDEAVEQVENESKGQRAEGGRTMGPEEKRR